MILEFGFSFLRIFKASGCIRVYKAVKVRLFLIRVEEDCGLGVYRGSGSKVGWGVGGWGLGFRV